MFQDGTGIAFRLALKPLYIDTKTDQHAHFVSHPICWTTQRRGCCDWNVEFVDENCIDSVVWSCVIHRFCVMVIFSAPYYQSYIAASIPRGCLKDLREEMTIFK